MFVTKIWVTVGLSMFFGLAVGGAGFGMVGRPPLSSEDAAKMETAWDWGDAKNNKPEEQRLPLLAASEVAAFEVGFHDGCTLKLKLKDEYVRLITPQGEMLLLPQDKIRRIEFAYATRLSENLRVCIDAAVANLGSEKFAQREKAVAELRRYGARACIALLNASKTQDLEVRLRAKSLLTDLRAKAFDEATFEELCKHDILYTVDAKFVGRVDVDSLTMCMNRADQVQVKTANVDFLQSLSIDLAAKFVEKLGGRVVRDEKANGRPVITVRFVGAEAFIGEGVADADLKELRRLSAPLSTLQTLDFICWQTRGKGRKLSGITDAGLKELREFKRLLSLNLTNCGQITGIGLKELKGLRSLSLNRCWRLTDASLKELKGLEGLQSLNLTYCRLTDAGLKELKVLQGFRSLSLDSCGEITDEGLRELKELKRLQTLKLAGCGEITDEGLKELKELKRLQTLDLANCGVPNAALAKLKKRKSQAIHLKEYNRITGASLKELKQLKELNLRTLLIGDADLKELKELEQLQTLNLADYRQITDVGLKQLKEFKRLQTLSLANSLDGDGRITDAGLKELKELQGLKSLNLAHCERITDAGLKELKELQTLDLANCWWITDAGLKELKELQGLRSLNLTNDLSDWGRITDAGLRELKELKRLQTLSLGNNIEGRITDAGLKELKELKELQTLDLARCRRITDAGLKELKELKELQTLNLADCAQIMDAGLKELKELKGLRSLNLFRCKRITDAGLKELEELPGLRELNIQGCRQITDVAVTNLRKNLPKLQIRRVLVGIAK